jgi:hypothetical protein
MQGFSVAMKMGMTLDDLKSTIGIHPTSAEHMVKMKFKEGGGGGGGGGGLSLHAEKSSLKKKEGEEGGDISKSKQAKFTQPPALDHC